MQNNYFLVEGEHFCSLGDEQTSTCNSSMDGMSKVLVHSPEDGAEISESGKLTKQTTAETDAEDVRVKEILSDSKMREILVDSDVQQLMSYLRSDPNKAQL